VIDDGKRKESSDAHSKNRSRKRRRESVMKGMLKDLRKELRLIDKTMVALIRLSYLRRESQIANRRRPD